MDGHGRTDQDPAVIDDDGGYEERSGHDLDIWGDGSPTRATPIPEDREDRFTTESAEDTENAEKLHEHGAGGTIDLLYREIAGPAWRQEATEMGFITENAEDRR